MSADILNEQMRMHYEACVIIFADVSPLQTVNTCLLTHLFWPPHMYCPKSFLLFQILKNFIPSHVDHIFKKQVEHGPAKLYQLHNTESKNIFIYF